MSKEWRMAQAERWTESMNNWIEDLAFGIKHDMDEEYKQSSANAVGERMRWVFEYIWGDDDE